jgi:hypothetical protein
MFKKTVLATALGVVLGAPHAAMAASADDHAALAQIRADIKAIQARYEARIQALEERLQASEARSATTAQAAATPASAAAVAPASPLPAPAPAAVVADTAFAAPPAASPPPPAPTAAGAGNGFNPAVSLILGGGFTNLSQDPNRYRLQGFMPGGGDIGPGKRGFTLGESELTLAASIDPRFSGRLTFSLTPDNQVSVEEALFESQGLSNGLNLKAGRFLSSIGYLNAQHAHTWDFVDAPLAYQAFFGGQYKPEGVQLRWLAPTERFIELGLELGRGATFPGNDRNKNGIGSSAVFAHIGDDIGESASYRAGLSYLRTSASQREFDDTDRTGASVVNAFGGNSGTWIADAIYKWSPNGNPVQTNLKLQGEYFRRTDHGELAYNLDPQGQASASGAYRAAQSGWYLQGVYQFTAGWRAGIRYDRLDSGNNGIGAGLDPANFARLAGYDPHRATAMLDYSPSEFSRFRLQYAQDRSRPEVTDHQIFLQYIMSLGAHGAHTF